MSHLVRRIFAALALAMPLLAAPLLPARAQQAPPDTNVIGPGAKKPARPAQPRALPGSRVEQLEAAPLERPPSEMKPNEALFDAINRGDLPACREAISRGAELERPNVLGLTALDLAIDLGRNDITFLLLSMRGASGRSNVEATTSATGAAPKNAGKPVAAVAPKPQPVARPVVEAPIRAATPGRQAVANDPGTPAPQAGFLGFGRSQP